MEPTRKDAKLKSLKNYVPSEVSLSKSESKLIKSIHIKTKKIKKDK